MRQPGFYWVRWMGRNPQSSPTVALWDGYEWRYIGSEFPAGNIFEVLSERLEPPKT